MKNILSHIVFGMFLGFYLVDLHIPYLLRKAFYATKFETL